MKRTVSIGRRDLDEWARSGIWPCSALRGCERLQVTFDVNGDLLDLHMWGCGKRDDLTSDELDAIVAHHFG